MSWVAGADRYYAELTPASELKISPRLTLHTLDAPAPVDFVTQFQEANLTGFGARAFADGVDTAGAYCIPSARIPNVEATEFTWPLLVLYRAEAPNSGGAGRWRGGLGGNFAFMLHKTDKPFVHVSAAFHVAIPNGGALSGGMPGVSVVYAMLRDSNIKATLDAGVLPQGLAGLTGALDVLQPKSQTHQGVDDIYAISFFGGGGYGDPLDRAFADVTADIAGGAVTPGEAARLYGAISTEGRIDVGASVLRRAALKVERLGHAVDLPTTGETDDPVGSVRLNEYLRVERRRIVCRRCGQDHCGEGENVKLSLHVKITPVTDLSPLNRDPADYIDEPVEFRRFFCPGCATQVETEVALSRNPFLWDVQLKPG